MNMCEYFDKPADNLDVNNNFNINYYPDDETTEMVTFKFKRRMECILTPSDYYGNTMSPTLRMDPLTQLVINNLLDDEVIDGKIHKD